MTDSVNPYRSCLAPYFPNNTGQEYKQDLTKVTHYFIYLNQEVPLDQWINPTDQNKIRQRINAQVTDKKLHPLHLCAMLNREKMAKKLLDTTVCQIDPQDYLGFTPLHHAAVNNFQNMIALLIKYGANQKLTNSRQGTYLQVLNLVHPSIDPLKQTFHYKDTQTGNIFQGNGIDFQQYTGAEAFLDKEPLISVAEMLNEWNTNPTPDDLGPAPMLPIVQKAYKQFREHPPLVYLEKREDVGINVCAGEEIKSGTVVAEYLGEIQRDSQRSGSSSTYTFEHFNSDKKRGIGALINDGFPNCITLSLLNTRGVLDRIILCATTRIPKGDSIVFNYGSSHEIKFKHHREPREQAMSAFVKKYTNESPDALLKDYQSERERIENMTDKNAMVSSYDSINKLLYLTTTPHAIIKLVSDLAFSMEAVQRFDQALSFYNVGYSAEKQAMRLVLSTLQHFSDVLKKMEPAEAQKCRETVLENLTKMDICGLINLMDSFGQTSSSTIPQPKES